MQNRLSENTFVYTHSHRPTGPSLNAPNSCINTLRKIPSKFDSRTARTSVMVHWTPDNRLTTITKYQGKRTKTTVCKSQHGVPKYRQKLSAEAQVTVQYTRCTANNGLAVSRSWKTVAANFHGSINNAQNKKQNALTTRGWPVQPAIHQFHKQRATKLMKGYSIHGLVNMFVLVPWQPFRWWLLIFVNKVRYAFGDRF